MTKHLTCIVCPMGCDLAVTLDENGSFLAVEGYTCKRGEAYAKTECTAPTRTVTSTVALEGGGVLPVKTASPIPKGLIFEAMRAIDSIKAPKGTRMGDVLIADLCGTGVALIATRHASEV